MYKKILLITMIIFFFVGWSNNTGVNTPVCTAQGIQSHQRIASDAYGGSIIVWQDERAGKWDIYAQLVDSTGTKRWAQQGIAICKVAGDQQGPQIIADGSGGAIIAWEDERGGNPDIYAQRINSAGVVQWATGGIPIGNGIGDQVSPGMIPDGNGGAVIAWQDSRDNGSFDIYAQRVRANGNVQWTANGVPVCTAANDQSIPALVSDGSGGAVISWVDYRLGSSQADIYARRVNGAGAVCWQADGVAICTAQDSQYGPQLTADGSGGAIIAWTDSRDYETDYMTSIYVQHIDSSGTILWLQNGIDVYTDYDWRRYLQVLPDGQNGAILVWNDYWVCYGCGQYGSYLTAQRIDASGNKRWGQYGVDICNGCNRSYRYHAEADGAGGVFVTWEEHPGDDSVICAQHLDSTGAKEWGTGGLTVSTRPGSKLYPRLVPDGAGGIIIAWYGDGIYAQNVCGSGGIGDCQYPTAVINADRFGGFAPVTIHFDGSGSFDPDGSITRWSWDFGDGDTSTQENVAHTYANPGKYNVTLRVKDNSGRWSAVARRMVLIYSGSEIDKVIISVSSPVVKASGKGRVTVRAACYEEQTDPNHEERPIPVDLGLNFTVTSGTWEDEISFGSGIYERSLISGAVGTATISAVLDNQVVASKQVTFAWPLPPLNLQVELKVNRSLFMGEYYAELSWAANPDEVFTPAKYRIYRSTNGGAFELVGEVDATTFSYVDASLPAGSEYRFAVSMVDTEDDESPTAQ